MRRVGSRCESRMGGEGRRQSRGVPGAGHAKTGCCRHAAAPPPQRSPLREMLMGFCRRRRVIGRREFGATSSCGSHWLSAICCSLCRELLAPPPIPFSSGSLPPASGPRPGTPQPQRRSEAFSPEFGKNHIREWRGGHQPRTGPRARSARMGTGEVSQETAETPRGRPVCTTPSCLPVPRERWEGGRGFNPGVGVSRRRWGPRRSLASASGSVRTEQWLCPAHHSAKLTGDRRPLGASGRAAARPSASVGPGTCAGC